MIKYEISKDIYQKLIDEYFGTARSSTFDDWIKEEYKIINRSLLSNTIQFKNEKYLTMFILKLK
jgi:hypothetical protein